MATTVSAVESKSIVYNLVRTVKINNNGEVTLKATFPNVPLVAGQYIDISVTGLGNDITLKDKNGVEKTVDGWNTKVTISGQYIDTNKAINPIVVCRNQWSSDISYANKYLLGGETGPDGTKNDWAGNTIRVPVKEINDGTPAFIGGDATATPERKGSATVTMTGSATATIADQNYTAAKVANGTVLTYKAKRNAVNASPAKWEYDADGTATATNPTAVTADQLAAIQAVISTNPAKDTKFTDAEQVFGTTTGTALFAAGSTVIFTAEVKASPEKAAGWYDANDNPVNPADLGVAVSGTPADTNTMTFTTIPYEPAKGGVMANITVTATIKGLPDLGDIYSGIVGGYVNNGTLNISMSNNGAAAVKGDCTMSNYKQADKVEQYPMMTNQSGDILENVKAGYKDASGNDVYKTVAIHDDIFAYLTNEYVNGDKGYKNAMAVVNDAVENYDSVVFKFNTPMRRRYSIALSDAAMSIFLSLK